jgi:hypothetical protein
MDYTASAAELARKAGIPAFSLVSSQGANPNSMFLYMEVKGKVGVVVAAFPQFCLSFLLSFIFYYLSLLFSSFFAFFLHLFIPLFLSLISFYFFCSQGCVRRQIPGYSLYFMYSKLNTIDRSTL